MQINFGNKGLEDHLREVREGIASAKEEIVEELDGIEIDLDDRVTQLIATAETIAFNYNEKEGRIELYSKVGNKAQTEYFTDIDVEGYDSFCEKFHVNVDEKYNCSTWFETEAGDLVRVFAVTAPVCKHPNVTLNISRKPKGIFDQKEVEPFIEDIFSSRFLIVGATGSGKTYFFNNALKRTFEGKDNRIAIVEEFHELFPPNENTFMMDANPGKPGAPSVFDYVIQQTNLMRINNIFVGEIKGSEAFPFVVNMSSGTNGGCTMHGKSAEDGLSRLRMLMTMAKVADSDTCAELIARAVKYVIYIERHEVKNIKKLTGVYNKASGKYQMDDLIKKDS